MRISLSIFIFLLILSPSRSHAAEAARSGRYTVSISEWFSISDSWWEISDPTFRSRLDFEETDSDITTFGGEIHFSKRFAVRASYGFGDIDDGRVVDSDRDGSNVQFSESRSKGRGDTSIFELGGSFLATKRQNPFQLFLYLGYINYRDDIRITDGVQTLSDNINVPPVGTVLTGLNSTYDFRWEFLKIGVEGELRKKGRFGLGGGAYYLYLDTYRGEAYWNLRAGSNPGDFKSQPPNFVHDADEGYGVDAFIAVSYNVSASAIISLGYRYFTLKAEDGTDTTYIVVSSSPYIVGAFTSSLDTVEAERKGPYVSFEMKF